MKKRILSIILCIVMLCSQLPAVALAAEADNPVPGSSQAQDGGEQDVVCDECKEANGVHLESCSSYTGSREGGGSSSGAHTDHCVCGGSISVGGHTHDTAVPTWTEWDGTADITGGGSYYLSGDVTVTDTVTLSGDSVVLNLCLNGHVLKLETSSAKRVIHVQQGATLNLCNCNASTTHTFSVSDGGLWTLKEGEAGENDKTLRGGVITGGTSSGIHVSYSQFHMYGGNIAGNFVPSSATRGGGGVCIYESIGSESTEGGFLMYGGAICGNISEKGEGGGTPLRRGRL